MSLAVLPTDGSLIVTDSGEREVVRIGSDGVVRVLGSPKEMVEPIDVCCYAVGSEQDRRCVAVVADRSASKLWKYSLNQNGEMTGPVMPFVPASADKRTEFDRPLCVVVDDPLRPTCLYIAGADAWIQRFDLKTGTCCSVA